MQSPFGSWGQGHPSVQEHLPCCSSQIKACGPLKHQLGWAGGMARGRGPHCTAEHQPEHHMEEGT